MQIILKIIRSIAVPRYATTILRIFHKSFRSFPHAKLSQYVEEMLDDKTFSGQVGNLRSLVHKSSFIVELRLKGHCAVAFWERCNCLREFLATPNNRIIPFKFHSRFIFPASVFIELLPHIMQYYKKRKEKLNFSHLESPDRLWCRCHEFRSVSTRWKLLTLKHQ